MWKPCGSLTFSRFFFRAAALAPPCGIVGMFGEAPVVLNWPNFSRLSDVSSPKAAEDASITATQVASIVRFCIGNLLPHFRLSLCTNQDFGTRAKRVARLLHRRPIYVSAAREPGRSRRDRPWCHAKGPVSITGPLIVQLGTCQNSAGR